MGVTEVNIIFPYGSTRNEHHFPHESHRSDFSPFFIKNNHLHHPVFHHFLWLSRAVVVVVAVEQAASVAIVVVLSELVPAVPTISMKLFKTLTLYQTTIFQTGPNSKHGQTTK